MTEPRPTYNGKPVKRLAPWILDGPGSYPEYGLRPKEERGPKQEPTQEPRPKEPAE